MERGQFELIIEARNQAASALRQFGSQIRRQMATARQQVQQTAKSMRAAGEDLNYLGRGGRVAGRGLQFLSALALRPLLGLLSLGLTAVMSLASGLASLASGVIRLATTIVTELLTALRRLISTATRVGLVLGTSLAIALGVSANKAASFGQEMRNVNTIVRASEAQFLAMSDAVLRLSTEVPQTADVLARGLYNVASAGFKGAAGLEVLEAGAYAAVAGLAQTDEAVKAITGVLNAYGWAAEQAGRVSDILFKTVERGVVTFPELAETIGMVVSTAASASIPFEELAAAFMTMTKGSINASVATTALNRIILSFLSPSEKLIQALSKVGIESAGAFIQAEGLGEAIKVLNQIAEGNPAILAEIGLEMRALRAAMSLVREEGTIFAKDIQAAYRAAGATQAAYAEQTKALRVQIALAKSSFAALAITLGGLFKPAIMAVAQSVGRITARMQEWIKQHPEIAKRMESMGRAIAAVLERAEGRIQEWLLWFSENWQRLWDTAVERVVAASDWIAEWIGRIVGAVQYLWATRSQIWDWAREFMSAMIAVGQTIAREVLARIEDLMGKMKILGILGAGVVGAVAGAKAGAVVGTTVGGIAGTLPGAIGGAAIGGFTGVAGAVIASKYTAEQITYMRADLQRWGSSMLQEFDRQRAGGAGYFGGLGSAAQIGGAGYRAGWQQWRAGIGAAAGGPGAGIGPGGLQQVGEGAWLFPADEVQAAVEQAAPVIANELAEAVTTYTDAQQVEWAQEMARLAEIEGRIADAVWYLAHAAGYQENITAGLRETYGATGTTESIRELADALDSLRGFYTAGGRLGQQGQGMIEPQLARQPVPWVIAPNVTVHVAGAEDFAQVGADLFHQIWEEEELGNEAMYGGWTGG